MVNFVVIRYIIYSEENHVNRFTLKNIAQIGLKISLLPPSSAVSLRRAAEQVRTDSRLHRAPRSAEYFQGTVFRYPLRDRRLPCMSRLRSFLVIRENHDTCFYYSTLYGQKIVIDVIFCHISNFLQKRRLSEIVLSTAFFFFAYVSSEYADHFLLT